MWGRLMPAVVRQFKSVAPTTKVSIVTGDNARLLDLARHGELDMVIGRLLAQAIEIPADTVETTATGFAAKYVRLTDGVWFVPCGAVAHDLADKRLAELAIRYDSLEGPVRLTTRLEDPLSPAASLMVQAIRALARAATDAGDSHLGMTAAKKAIWSRSHQ